MAAVILFIDPAGQRVFKNIVDAAREKSSEDAELYNLAPFLTDTGWPCKLTQRTIKTGRGARIAYGLEFLDQESLTAFILRWGG